MRRRPGNSIVANPVLVGAVTALVVVVAVLLAYNANRGLPFVPTTQLKFQVSSGANLLPGNEVREGGYRIGIVDVMVPRRLPDGTVGAEVTIKLDKNVGEIPVDSRLRIRPRSVLGLKYVQLSRGSSKEHFAEGARVPADQTSFSNDLEALNSLYDKRTRTGVQRGIKGFGNAFARRGASLNLTLQEAPRFLTHLEPVMESLARPSTQLTRFLKELADVTRIIAPLAPTYASSFRSGANVFEAWSRYPVALGEYIEKAAPTFRTGIASFAVQRPFLVDYTAMNRSLARATRELPRTLPRITTALQVGTPVVRRSAETNEQLQEALTALQDLMADPATPFALRGVIRLVDIVDPLVRYAGPFITVCNYFNYAWGNTGEHLTEPDPTGFSQRTLLNQASRPQNPTDPSMGSIGAKRPSSGEPVVSGAPAALHSNAYGAAVTHGGAADCESGQRGYMQKLTAYNTDPDFKVVNDPHIPGASGTTYTGRERVPEGQTFNRLPTMGPALPKELDK